MKTLFAFLLTALFVPTVVLSAQEERFASSDGAIKALTEAGSNKDTNALTTIFGPAVKDLISADPVQASNALASFSRRISERVAPVPASDSKIQLNRFRYPWSRRTANGFLTPRLARRKSSTEGSDATSWIRSGFATLTSMPSASTPAWTAWGTELCSMRNICGAR
jgi:hypothetical protein